MRMDLDARSFREPVGAASRNQFRTRAADRRSKDWDIGAFMAGSPSPPARAGAIWLFKVCGKHVSWRSSSRGGCMREILKISCFGELSAGA